ncbi:hypothetical protein E2C01_013607 [Portunus trituberculatus]|uniref:Uncharacterized protein n=1 Tax=Portunus trituberculatus TaxID=210409 RepID=A0A5B7DHH5_PORTR|nr:hypothetical protein [Portunus trituberculatus]
MLQKLMKKKLREVSRQFGSPPRKQSNLVIIFLILSEGCV